MTANSYFQSCAVSLKAYYTQPCSLTAASGIFLQKVRTVSLLQSRRIITTIFLPSTVFMAYTTSTVDLLVRSTFQPIAFIVTSRVRRSGITQRPLFGQGAVQVLAAAVQGSRAAAVYIPCQFLYYCRSVFYRITFSQPTITGSSLEREVRGAYYGFAASASRIQSRLAISSYLSSIIQAIIF